MLFAAEEVMSTGLPWEAVAILVGTMTVLGGSLIRFAFVISTQMTKIVARLDAMQVAFASAEGEHDEFYRRINGHDIVLAGHGQRIEVIEENL